MTNLKEKYEILCECYVEAFLRKHNLFDDETGEYCDYSWVGDDVGSILEVSDYYISFDDIRYDINNAIPKDTYFEYYNYCIEKFLEERKVNYHSYIKGFRFEDKKK